MIQMFLNKSEKKTYVIASPIEGVLQKDGKPLSNIKMIRRLRWNGNEGGIFQKVITDRNGAFQFPLHEETLTMTKLAQFVAKADIEIEFEGEKVDLWYSTKFLEGLYDDTAGQFLNDLVCDISNSEERYRNGASKLSTLCRWNDD